MDDEVHFRLISTEPMVVALPRSIPWRGARHWDWPN